MNPQHEPARNDLHGEQVSALCDDRLDALELDELLARCRDGDAVQAQWHGYQLIGEVLRGQSGVLPACAPSAFLDRLHASLAAEPQPSAQPVVAAQPPRSEAANEAVFRWKLVSGFASVVALAAVGWNLLASTAPARPDGGATLVQNAPAAATPPLASTAQPVLASVPASEARPVVVSTPQGRVIRDAALERLLAEHRQHGGMSAFQSSTGFIRNATYDDDAR